MATVSYRDATAGHFRHIDGVWGSKGSSEPLSVCARSPEEEGETAPYADTLEVGRPGAEGPGQWRQVNTSASAETRWASEDPNCATCTPTQWPTASAPFQW